MKVSRYFTYYAICDFNYL